MYMLNVALVLVQASYPLRITLPISSSVVNAVKDLGAVGDGVADDSDALQRSLDISCGISGPTKILYLPNGRYRVTRSLMVNNAIGPWMYGESRKGFVIKLADGVTGVTSVLRTHPRESGGNSADWFMRKVRNLTIDVGINPGTDGVRWYANNSGLLKDVTIRGRGKIGINAGFFDQNGPNVVQDVSVQGMEAGILSQWMWGETFSRIDILDCRQTGLKVEANAVGIEGLSVARTPVALEISQPNEWSWWSGVVSLIGARMDGNRRGPTIRNRGVL